MLFQVSRTSASGVPTLQVHGELDLATAPVLAEAVEQLLAPGPPHALGDLTWTSFLDSTGARELALAARAARSAGTRLQVVCPPDNAVLQRVIGLLDLGSLVDIVAAPPSAEEQNRR